MARRHCDTCGRTFRGAHAYDGHLRTCSKTRADAQPAQPAGSAPSSAPKGSANVLKDEVEVQKTKLELRQVKAAHGQLDEEERTRKREDAERRQREKREREDLARAEAEAKARVQEEREGRERRERQERELKTLRRGKIQTAKGRAVDQYFPPAAVTAELEAQAREAIERKLTTLAVEELSDTELAQIAEAERDRIYRPALEARWQEEERKRAEEHQRKEAKRARLDRGRTYAAREMKSAAVADADQWYWLLEVEAALARSIAGDEHPEAIEAMVDTVLSPKLKELEKQRREQEQAERARERVRRKGERLDHAERYARDELADVEEPEERQARRELAGLRLSLPGKIRRELEAELTGDETEADVEDMVDDALRAAGVE